MSEEAGTARQTGPALEAMHRLILWLVPTVEKFPRAQKFLLAERIQTTALGCLERLIEATYSRGREPVLGEANVALEKLRMLFRIAFELRCLDARRYEQRTHASVEVT